MTLHLKISLSWCVAKLWKTESCLHSEHIKRVTSPHCSPCKAQISQTCMYAWLCMHG